MFRPKASTGSSRQTPSPPVPATPEPYHPSPIPPLVQTPPTAKPPRTVAKGPSLVMGASWNPQHLGGCVGGGGGGPGTGDAPQWREVGTCTTREGAQMRAQNSPAPHRWPSCPQLPQGLAFPGGSGQRSRPGRGWVGPRLGGRAVPVHPGRPCSHRWAIVVSTEALALGGNECNQASHPWRICGAGGWQATQKPSESFSTQVYRNAVYFVGDVGSVNYAAGTA